MKTFTKTVIAFILVTFCTDALLPAGQAGLCVSPCFAQSGQTCNTAIQNYAKDSCAYQSWVISGTEYWFYFKANTPYVYISVITTKFGINAPHVHRVELYDGTCSNPILIADDELPFVDYWDELRIDLDASGLIPGNKYYIRLLRQPSGGKLCDKSTCRAMIQPAGFDICIQDVEVFIPLDFGIEPPSQSHSYVQNKGQIIDTDGNPRSDIVMVAPNSFPSVFVANTAIHYVFSKIDTSISTLDTLHRIDMTLENANPNMRAFKTEQAQGHFNYFLPQTPNGVSSKAFSRLVWNDVYPEIDMQFYSNYNGIKFYFIVRQGGDAEDIEMKFDGASQLIVTPDSGLEIISSLGKLQFEPGHAYQINPAGNIVPMPWQAKFIKTAANKVKFDIRNYPKNMPLIIQVDRGHTFSTVQIQGICRSTFYGGSNSDGIYDSYLDEQFNLYITGYTYGYNFPITDTSLHAGNKDIFISKFNKQDSLLFSTFYGGTGWDEGIALVTDNAHNIYVTGNTKSSDFPVCQNCSGFLQDTSNLILTNSTAFIIILDTNGRNRYFGTYFGGNNSTKGLDVCLNDSGFTIVGLTSSSAPIEIPLKNYGSSYYQDFNNSLGPGSGSDGFIANFDNQYNLIWSTYIGGSNHNVLYSCKYDNSNLFIAGYSTDTLFQYTCEPLMDSLPICIPNTFAFIDTPKNKNGDIWLMEFNNNRQLYWSTLYGGTYSDQAMALFIDSAGNLYVAAVISSNDFPLLYDSTTFIQLDYHGGTTDCGIAKFDKNLSQVWSTYFGGNDYDWIEDIICDKKGNCVITGFTMSRFFMPLVNKPGLYTQPQHNGDWFDAYVAWFYKDSLVWSTYLGGEYDDQGFSAAFTDDSCIIISGITRSWDFPLQDVPGITDYFDDSLGYPPPDNYFDGFITSLSLRKTPFQFIADRPDLFDNNFQVYPNPAHQQLIINIPQNYFSNNRNVHLQISILDPLGKTVYRIKHRITESELIALDVSFLEDGLYFITIADYNIVFRHKFLKIQQ